MQRTQVQLAIVVLLLIPVATRITAAQTTYESRTAMAAVSGIVRDAQGVVQRGALIEIAALNSVKTASAFTDIHGRYVIANLAPGKYQVKASAALFVPALRDNLSLRSGARSVVNLTLTTLFESSAWIPAERRKADEPGDDWKWTLRSAANRPILRMVEDGEIVLVSSSATETAKSYDSGKNLVMGGDGNFGQGGVHNVVSLDRGFYDGSDVRIRIDMGTTVAPGQYQVPFRRPSSEMQAGYQRRTAFGGATRLVASYQSHPEMMGNDHSTGFEATQFASAQKMQFGDMAEVEAGSSLAMVRTLGPASGYLSAARPFLRVDIHPMNGWTLGYRVATSRDVQAFNSLDAVRPELPVAVMSKGHLRTEKGLHQEVAVSRKVGKGLVQASYFHDNLDAVAVGGGGGLSAADLNPLDSDPNAAPSSMRDGVIADSTTGGFRLLSSGYRSQGIKVLFTQPLASGVWAAVEYENGSAMAFDGAGSQATGQLTLANVRSGMRPVAAHSATVALKGTVFNTRTSVRAAYKWQPVSLVTAVDPYAAFSDQAYLGFFLRQPINAGSWLPAGFEATVDVTNLLAQGYRPFLSADGRTIYLAQAPRSIQAGLAFNF